MRLSAVVDLLSLADDLGVVFWVNCGWGVDATLGRQTRDHRDLDLLVERRHEARFTNALCERGFAPREDDPDAQPWSYVLVDSHGHEVDVHVVEQLPDGDWAYGPEGGAPEEVIPAHALSGEGQIGSRRVRCPTPETLVRWHTGYAPAERDWSDVSLLCRRFGITIPADYAAYHERE